jgi:diadenosine tetraphosphatase ApaH/serine/threonine PP2A family protein phosphatase
LISQMPLGFVEMRQAFGRDGEYGRWLRQLPVAIKIDGLLFVHGGISPEVAPLGCDGINDQVKRELTSDLEKTRANALASLTARADGPLWYRGLAQEPDTFAPQLTEILSKLRVRAIVVAHTVTPLNRITTRFDGRVIEIDTGMQPAYTRTDAPRRSKSAAGKPPPFTWIAAIRWSSRSAKGPRRSRSPSGGDRVSTIERKDRKATQCGLMRKPSARTVHTIMRALAAPSISTICLLSKRSPRRARKIRSKC